MHRFYIDPLNISNDTAILEEDDARHLQQVLRLKRGHLILLFDGSGTTYKAQIEEFTRASVKALILESTNEKRKKPFLHIAQCVVKKKKMELIVQKSTELGIDSFIPVVSHNCSLTYSPSTQESRWRKIAVEACKQCGRSHVPEIRGTANISDFFADLKAYDRKIILWENESKKGLEPFSSLDPPESVLLLIGPEGGFSSEEVSTALSAGFTSATLGNLTMRAETAAIAALSVTHYLLNIFPNQGSKQ